MVIFTGSFSVHTKFAQKLDENWIRAGNVGDSLLLTAVKVDDGLELEVTDPQENY